jgi:hypothetical protein
MDISLGKIKIVVVLSINMRNSMGVSIDVDRTLNSRKINFSRINGKSLFYEKAKASLR